MGTGVYGTAIDAAGLAPTYTDIYLTNIMSCARPTEDAETVWKKRVRLGLIVPQRAHTRVDDTLVAYIAAPVWALLWHMTFAHFGKPLTREVRA